MAEIPIEKKRSGGLWWLWALIAVIVLALLAWLIIGNDNDRDAVQPTATTAAVAAPAGQIDDTAAVGGYATADAGQSGPVTDLQTLGDGHNAALIGRDVTLTNVPVGDVSGDANFWITGNNGQKYYVVLNEVRTPNTPIEGRVDVDKGDHVDLTGTIRDASNGAPAGAAVGTKTDPIPDGVTQYIYAQSAQVRG